jgi:hypothetical protein
MQATYSTLFAILETLATGLAAPGSNHKTFWSAAQIVRLDNHHIKRDHTTQSTRRVESSQSRYFAMRQCDAMRHYVWIPWAVWRLNKSHRSIVCVPWVVFVFVPRCPTLPHATPRCPTLPPRCPTLLHPANVGGVLLKTQGPRTAFSLDMAAERQTAGWMRTATSPFEGTCGSIRTRASAHVPTAW